MDLDNFEGVSHHKFVVTASNLEYLVIQDDLLVNFEVNGRSLLNEVSLNVGVDILLIKYYSQFHEFEVSHDEANRVMKLLRGVNYTKILSLTSYTMNSLNIGFDDNMPTFPNLICLEMCIEARIGWKLLPHFLNSSSNLEVLILKMESNQEYSPEEFVQFESESVPSCLRLHMKTIEIRNMTGDELEVISYMLKNSEVLEEFSVGIANEKLKKILLTSNRTRALSAPSSLDVAEQDVLASIEYEEQEESKSRVGWMKEQQRSSSPQPLLLPSPQEGLSSVMYKASFGDDASSSKKFDATVTCLNPSAQGLKEFINEVNTIASLKIRDVVLPP
ncbi:hypothetical protein LWI28_016012 [Acer negundo]|uniref:FBD domain-containing protein n=1 Tax=Acer negundo TaxID=4023 RepID=A0AAD5NEZ4_ACENE|nr:hypothetical protein LWI28_016012 [Acer negundo]